jgi:hypothetical protein
MKFQPLYLFRHKILLVLIILFFILNNLIWWQNNKFIQGPDEGRHLSRSIEIYTANSYLDAFLNFNFFEPPFYYFTTCVFYKIFHNTSYNISMLNNILYIIILLIGISKLERMLLNTSGLFSPLFLIFIPAAGIHSRFFNPDIASCSIIVWFMCFIKNMNDTGRLKYFLILILLIYLGEHTKVSFFLFSIFPIAYYFFLALKRKEIKRIIFNFALAIMLFSLFTILFRRNFPFNVSLGYMYNHLPNVSADQYYVQQNLIGKIYYAISLIINSQLSGVIFIFFIFSFIVFIISQIKIEDKFGIIIYFFGGLFIFILINLLHLETRYFLPLVIPEAIIISYGIHFLLKKKIAFRLIAIIFISFSIIQYYGISYSKNWVDYFPKIRIFNKEINLSYYPATSHSPNVWSLPYHDNPLEEIINIIYENSKRGILLPTVCFLYDRKEDTLPLFLADRLRYYLLRKSLYGTSVSSQLFNMGFLYDVYDKNFIIISNSYFPNKGSASAKELLCKNRNKGTSEKDHMFAELERYLEMADYQLHKTVDIYNPLANGNEPFFLYLKNNRNFLTLRKRFGDVYFAELSITLQQDKILTLANSLILLEGENRFSLKWPESKFSIRGELKYKPNKDIMLEFYSEQVEDIKAIKVKIMTFFRFPLYYYDNESFKLFKDSTQKLILENKYALYRGLKTDSKINFFLCIPRLPYKDFVSQMYINKKNILETVYYFKPISKDKDFNYIFSFYLVRDLDEYKKELAQASNLERK